MQRRRGTKRLKSVLAILLALLLSFSSVFVFAAGGIQDEAARNGKIQLIVQIQDCEKLSTVVKDPVFTGKVIYGKLVDNDRVHRIGITYSREPGIVAGKYKINGTIVSDKYEVSFVPGMGTLTIKPGRATPKK